MSRPAVIADGLARLNAGRSLVAWGKSARVSEVNDLARQLGLAPQATKAATISSIARAPRPAAVDEGLSVLTSGGSLRAWGRRVRSPEVSALARRVGVEPLGSKAATLDAIRGVSGQTATLAKQGQVFPAVVTPFESRAADVFEQRRLKLFENLANVNARSDAGRMTAYSKAVREWGQGLKAELKRQLAKNDKAMGNLAREHLRELFGKKVPTDQLDALQGLRQYEQVIDKFVAEMASRMLRQLVSRIGQQPLRTAQELAGPNKRSTIGAYLNRARLIARMEALRAYNEALVALARGLKAPRGRVLRKRIVEIIDPRNHPFSRAADGTTAGIDEPFKVSVVAVAQEAAAMGVSAAGVFWNVRDGNYVGTSLPAHYNDRGRVVVEAVRA